MSHSAFCGLSRDTLASLSPNSWRRGDRRCQAGARPKCELVFTGRLLVTLVRLRTGLTHEALSVIYQVGSSAIGRAIVASTAR